MAKGRMINNKITGDKRINDLSDDTSRLAYTWLITFTDCEGRTHGDPAMVRSMLFPRRNDISIEKIEQYISEWAAIGLIIWYEADGDKWIYFQGFLKNQYIRKDREAPSDIPGYDPEHCEIIVGTTPELFRSLSGVTPDEIPVKLKEIKLKETNTETKDGGGGVFRAYENNIGMITPHVSEQLQELEKDYSMDWIIEAIQIAVENNVRKLSYIRGILKKWGVDGKGSNKPDVHEYAEVY